MTDFKRYTKIERLGKSFITEEQLDSIVYYFPFHCAFEDGIFEKFSQYFELDCEEAEEKLKELFKISLRDSGVEVK